MIQICIIECDIALAKSIHRHGNIAYYIGVISPSVDELRVRIKAGTKASTLDINVLLEQAVKALEEIQNCSFLSYRITNDEFETSYANFQNSVTALYPYLKTNYDDIQGMMIQRRQKIEDFNNKKVPSGPIQITPDPVEKKN